MMMMTMMMMMAIVILIAIIITSVIMTMTTMMMIATTAIIPFVVVARCICVVGVFARGAMGRLIDPSWWYVLSCLCGDAYKGTLAANRKV